MIRVQKPAALTGALLVATALLSSPNGVRAVTAIPWQLARCTVSGSGGSTGGDSLTASGSTQCPPPPGTPPPGNTNHTICLHSGLNNVQATLTAAGALELAYRSSGSWYQAITALQEWKAYSSCVTTTPTQASISCRASPLQYHTHVSGVLTSSLATCSIDFTTTIAGWGPRPGSGGSPVGAYNQCIAQLSNPNFYAATSSGPVINFLPANRWFINLPVEYDYQSSPTPSGLKISGQTQSSCGFSLPSFTNTAGSTVTTTTVSGLASLHLSVAAGVATPYMVEVNVESGNGSTLQTSSCSAPDHPIIPASQLPHYQPNQLSSYSSYFNLNGVCNFTPNWVGVPGQLTIAAQEVWHENVVYTISGSAYLTETSITRTYRNGRLVSVSPPAVRIVPEGGINIPHSATINVFTPSSITHTQLDRVVSVPCTGPVSAPVCPQAN